MKPQKLMLYSTNTGSIYRTIIKTNHGRIMYLELTIRQDETQITNCYYIDRTQCKRYYAVPKKLTTTKCITADLPDVIARELDRKYFGVKYCDDFSQLNTEEFIRRVLDKMQQRYKFLILVKSQPLMLKTRFKNRIHRSIYLEITHSGEKGVIADCHYYDRKYKRNNTYITPSGLTSITFDFSLENILEIVNNELNCDFTDVIITQDSFGFDSCNLPICGSI